MAKKKSYEVFIPKYEYTQDSKGNIKKKTSDSSVRMLVEAVSEPDAAFNVLKRIDIDGLNNQGYDLHDIKVSEVFSGSDMRVFIKGVTRKIL